MSRNGIKSSADFQSAAETLPEGWTTARIGDVLKLYNGAPFKPTQWSTSGLPIIRIQNLNNPKAPFNHFEGELNERFRVRKGDLLFAWSGTPGTSFGAHIWKGDDAWLNQHIFRVEFDAQLFDREFLRLAINRNLNAYIAEAHGGAGLAHITKGRFEAFDILLPPLAEQRRIVARLEALEARSRRARAKLVMVPAQLAQARQSLLAAAFRGELTNGWRSSHREIEPIEKTLQRVSFESSRTGRSASDEKIPGVAGLSVGDIGPPPPVGWVKLPLLKVARLESGHTPSREHSEYWGGEVPWISIPDARRAHGQSITDTASFTNALGLANSAARLLPAGTVCLSRTASVGYVTVMSKPMATSQDFANWVCSNALLPEFLMMAFLAEGEHLLSFGRGSTHTTIYYPELKALHLFLPPLAEQHEIVRRLRAAFARLNAVAAAHTAAVAAIDRLDQSLLARAFSGQLVPQTE